MLTVPQAARRAGKNPETIRRWIREGKLRAGKVGTQHIIDEADLDGVLGGDDRLPAPEWWDRTAAGEPMPNWISLMREDRSDH